MGHVRANDDDWDWLVNQGISPRELDRVRTNAAVPDVLGLNYYPELSCREVVRLGDRTVHVALDAGFSPLRSELLGATSTFGLPIMVTETGVEGSSDKKSRWLQQAVAGISELRHQGTKLVGLTWWPLFDFVDWSWASGGEGVEEFFWRDHPGAVPRSVSPPGRPGGPLQPFLRRMGLYELGPGANGPLTRVPTAALDRFARYAAGSGRGENPLTEQPVLEP
jgi:hypothetical protein